MIVTAHYLLCNGWGERVEAVLYKINTTARFARFRGMLSKIFLKKIVSFGAFLVISGSDFVSNHFLTGHLLWRGGGDFKKVYFYMKIIIF